jgi:hypothetical protein
MPMRARFSLTLRSALWFGLSVVLSLSITGCLQQTREISTGDFGPFSIGEDKAAVLAKLEDITDLHLVTVAPVTDAYLDPPTGQSVHELDSSDVALVWLDHHPFPLRIEYKDDVVARTWGTESECRASKPRMNIACEELKRLNSAIGVGLTRDQSYQAVLSFPTQLSKQMAASALGTSVVGESASDHRRHLLESDAWEFDGLRDQSRFSNPYYSNVTLYFSGGRLARVKHWSAPYELP